MRPLVNKIVISQKSSAASVQFLTCCKRTVACPPAAVSPKVTSIKLDCVNTFRVPNCVVTPAGFPSKLRKREDVIRGTLGTGAILFSTSTIDKGKRSHRQRLRPGGGNHGSKERSLRETLLCFFTHLSNPCTRAVQTLSLVRRPWLHRSTSLMCLMLCHLLMKSLAAFSLSKLMNAMPVQTFVLNSTQTCTKLTWTRSSVNRNSLTRACVCISGPKLRSTTVVSDDMATQSPADEKAVPNACELSQYRRAQI